MPVSQDEKIVKGCLKGDRKAQKELYLKFKYQMFGVCLRFAKDRDEAEDMLQEGFINVFRDLYQYQPVGPLGGWIRRVMINTALGIIRKRKNVFVDMDINELAENYETGEMVFDQLGEQELVMMIRQLPDGYRTVFNLYVIEGYAHHEIAKMLGISTGTSKSQLSRAKNMLKEMIAKTLDVPYYGA